VHESRSLRLAPLVIATLFALVAFFAVAAIGASSAQAQTVPGYTCSVLTVGPDAIITFAGNRARSENLLIDGSWERTVTNDSKFLAEDKAGATFQVRLRGSGYTGPNGYAEATCQADDTKSWSCTATPINATTARLSITGDRADSENLHIDGSWHSTITGVEPFINAASNAALEVRLRGLGYGSHFGWYPAECGWVAPQDFVCSATTDGADAIITFGGARAGSENLLADGRWVKTVTGLESFRATNRADQQFEIRLRGDGYSGSGVSFTTEVCSTSRSGLLWEDDFNGTSVDLTKWEVFEGQYGTPYRAQTYARENVRVENGSMFLEATYDANADQYFSGMVFTNNEDLPANPQYARGNLGWTYGRFELRAKVPHGFGLWPALWMRPVDGIYEVDGTSRWPVNGEIDILEYIGPGRNAERPGAPVNEIVHNIHYLGERNNGETVRKQDKETWAPPGDPATFVEGFHVYALEWEPKEMRFYVDGELRHTVADWQSVMGGAAPFDQPFDIIMNLQVGGWAGTPDPADYPSAMEIDWVRVYDLEG